MVQAISHVPRPRRLKAGSTVPQTSYWRVSRTARLTPAAATGRPSTSTSTMSSVDVAPSEFSISTSSEPAVGRYGIPSARFAVPSRSARWA